VGKGELSYPLGSQGGLKSEQHQEPNMGVLGGGGHTGKHSNSSIISHGKYVFHLKKINVMSQLRHLFCSVLSEKKKKKKTSFHILKVRERGTFTALPTKIRPARALG
jgi:hypothetical protein